VLRVPEQQQFPGQDRRLPGEHDARGKRAVHRMAGDVRGQWPDLAAGHAKLLHAPLDPRQRLGLLSGRPRRDRQARPRLRTEFHRPPGVHCGLVDTGRRSAGRGRPGVAPVRRLPRRHGPRGWAPAWEVAGQPRRRSHSLFTKPTVSFASRMDGHTEAQCSYRNCGFRHGRPGEQGLL
jgi:hypothetical protein